MSILLTGTVLKVGGGNAQGKSIQRVSVFEPDGEELYRLTLWPDYDGNLKPVKVEVGELVTFAIGRPTRSVKYGPQATLLGIVPDGQPKKKAS